MHNGRSFINVKLGSAEKNQGGTSLLFGRTFVLAQQGDQNLYICSLPRMLVALTSACLWQRPWSLMGQDEQTVPGTGRRAAVVSYWSSGDCGPGPVLSSTRGMGQLKEPSPCRTTNRALLAEL